ncbi:MAG: hypothetical protein R6X02_19540 [Enhygromyxa sp.]
MRSSPAGLAITLMLCSCTSGAAPAQKGEAVELPGTATVQPDPPAAADQNPAEAELDRTIWNCEWSIVVFWGPNMHWVHRDVAMAAMGTNTLFAREDLELVYGPERGSFSAALRHREYPNGQRGPEDFDGPLRPHTYEIDGRRLTIHAAHWADGPLECTADCYNQEFIDHMDAHYQTQSSAAALADKMRAGECGG